MNLSPGSICLKNKEKEILIFGQNDPSLHNAPGIDFLEFLTIFPFLMGLQRRVSDSFRLADGGGGRVGGQTHPGGDSDTNTSPPKMASIRQRTTVRDKGPQLDKGPLLENSPGTRSPGITPATQEPLYAPFTSREI